MDSDDIMVPDELKQLGFMLQNPSCKICGSRSQCSSNDKKIFSTTNRQKLHGKNTKKILKIGLLIIHQFVITTAIIDSGNYDPTDIL